ncbi:lipoprotein nuclease [Mycoplasmopsis californica]|uniref:Lipoprotein nuclease n=1 Tax=Mycoplasmopsis californica TaxID=2113 RepID=A0A059XRA2_9BACT|nr:endonuclease [Mycoplasmopsis californica]AIA29293.1 lipoprotein nuclease [Mycoplasmopsis californica]
MNKKIRLFTLSTATIIPLVTIACQKTTQEQKTFNSKYIYTDSEYYKGLDGLKGVQLFDELVKIQNRYWTKNIQRKESNYSELYKIYPRAFKDNFYEKDNTVLDIYSENPKGSDPYNFDFKHFDGKGGVDTGKNIKGEGNKYNREHLIPQSWFGRNQQVRTDAHFVWPTDKKVNELRGNSIFAPTPNGKKSLNGTLTSKLTSEPIDEFKGDVARAMFYFVLTHDEYSKQSNFIFEDKKPYIASKYLEIYKDWAKKDAIDAFDIQRNNEIAKVYGGLRNPFCDYPELVDLIFNPGDKVFKDKGVLVSVAN